MGFISPFILRCSTFFAFQAGAIASFFPNRGGITVHMSATDFYDVINPPKEKKEFKKKGRRQPSVDEFRLHFQGLWESSMNADNGINLETNWKQLERVLAPLYFKKRDWVPIVPKGLYELQKACQGGTPFQKKSANSSQSDDEDDEELLDSEEEEQEEEEEEEEEDNEQIARKVDQQVSTSKSGKYL